MRVYPIAQLSYHFGAPSLKAGPLALHDVTTESVEIAEVLGLKAKVWVFTGRPPAKRTFFALDRLFSGSAELGSEPGLDGSNIGLWRRGGCDTSSCCRS